MKKITELSYIQIPVSYKTKL